MHVRDTFYVDGQWVKPLHDGIVEVISPATEQVVGRVPDGQPADIDRAVDAARKSFNSGAWSGTSPAERSDVLERALSILVSRSEEISQTITEEMGSTISFSRLVQVPAPLSFLRYYIGLSRDY